MLLLLIRYEIHFRLRICSNCVYASQSETLLTEKPTVRAANAMPPLLQRLTERRPENLDYLGVSYGLTPQLLR